MALAEEFTNAVKEHNRLLVRIMMKDSLVADPTCREFDQMEACARAEIPDLYDAHDGEVFSTDLSAWTKEYMDMQMVKVVNNFSRERLDLLKQVCRHIYHDRVKRMENEDLKNSHEKTITRRQAGTAITVGGVAVASVGLAISKPVVVTAGVAAAVAGGIILLTDR